MAISASYFSLRFDVHILTRILEGSWIILLDIISIGGLVDTYNNKVVPQFVS